MEIKIYTKNKDLSHDIFAKKSLSHNDEIEIANNIKLRYNSETLEEMSFGSSHIVKVTLIFPDKAQADLLADLLASKLNDKSIEKVEIDGIHTFPDRNGLKEAIESHLRINN